MKGDYCHVVKNETRFSRSSTMVSSTMVSSTMVSSTMVSSTMVSKLTRFLSRHEYHKSVPGYIIYQTIFFSVKTMYLRCRKQTQ